MERGREGEVIFPNGLFSNCIVSAIASRLCSYIGIVLHTCLHVAEFFVLGS